MQATSTSKEILLRDPQIKLICQKWFLMG